MVNVQNCDRYDKNIYLAASRVIVGKYSNHLFVIIDRSDNFLKMEVNVISRSRRFALKWRRFLYERISLNLCSARYSQESCTVTHFSEIKTSIHVVPRNFRGCWVHNSSVNTDFIPVSYMQTTDIEFSPWELPTLYSSLSLFVTPSTTHSSTRQSTSSTSAQTHYSQWLLSNFSPHSYRAKYGDYFHTLCMRLCGS
jgi:hypothetical protein